MEDEAPALDPVEVAEKFNESGLPKIALTRVVEALKSETNTKTVDELIAEEKNYVSLVSESAVTAVATSTSGVIREAATTNLVDEWAAITSRITRK